MLLLELFGYNDFAVMVVFLSTMFWLHRYFVMSSGEAKTGLKFIKRWDIFSGSRDIIFENGKLMAVNAEDRHNELGDTFGCFWGDRLQVFTRDPDLVYKISVTDFQKYPNRMSGSLSKYMRLSLLEAPEREWRKSRRAIGQVLKASKLKSDNVETDIDDILAILCDFMKAKIEETSTNGKVFEMHQTIKNFVFQTILKVLFDTTGMVDFNRNYNEVVADMDNFIRHNYDWIVRVCFFNPPLQYPMRPFLGLIDHGLFANKLSSRLKAVADRVAAEKKNAGAIDSRAKTTIHSLVESSMRGELTQDQVIANAFFLNFAGFATTADTTVTILWFLAKEQERQDRLRQEVLKYGEESEYLEWVINETLRLYPGSITIRHVDEHLYWKNFRVVKGCHITMNIYSLHRDPKLWGDDVYEWKPERFKPSKRAKWHPAQFIPFGVGQRNCVGVHFARLEITKVIAQLIIKFKFDLCPTTPRKISFMPIGALPFALPTSGPYDLKVSLIENRKA